MPWRSVRWWTSWLLSTAFGFFVGSIPLFILYEVIAGLFVSDVVAFMEKDGPFLSSLTIGFAGGGAGIGLMQWLHLRRRIPGGARWIGLMAMAFALVAVSFGALYIAFGEAHLETASGRLANELAHGIFVGIVFALASWAWFGRHHDVDQRLWFVLALLAFGSTGIFVWGLESVFTTDQSDFSWIGMFVLGSFTGGMWWPVVRSTLAAPPAMATAGPAPG